MRIPATTRHLMLGAATIAMAIAGPAMAQDRAAPADQAQENGTNLAEIIVTAQRQSQNLLDVPLSVTAQSGEELTKLGVRDIVGLQFTVPGFVPFSRSDSTLIFVRGIGNGLFTGADPSVSTYIDDVPRVYGQLVSALVDVERIELLKGAQGGLYGRNATGGVLNIITRQPSTEGFEANVRASYGTKETVQVAARINVPLGEKAAFSLSGMRDSHDYYFPNDAYGSAGYSAANFPLGSYLGTPQQTADFFNTGVKQPKGYGNRDFWSAYGKLLLLPTEDLTITLAGDYNKKDDSEGMQARQEFPEYMRATFQNFFTNFGIAGAVLPPGSIFSSDRKFHVTRGTDSRNVLESYGGSLTAVLGLGAIDLTSITAYRKHYAAAFDELGDVNFPLLNNDSVKRAHFFYQEVRAATVGDGPLQLIGGATYLKNHFAQTSVTFILPPLYTTPLTSSVARTTNWSVYAQATYDLTTALSLTASGRYIHETNRTAFSSPSASTTSAKVKRFLPSATLSYRFDGGGNVYARWARGFKGGGVNPVVPPSDFPTTLGSVFGPEIVDTFEIGLRAPLADRRVQLTSAIFYNDYRGLQISTPAKPTYPAIIYTIVNAGSARTWGAEASLTWKVLSPLTVGVSGAYLNAKYKTFRIPDGTPIQPFDSSGQTMKNAPKFQFSAYADLDLPVSDRFRVVGSVLSAYTDKILFSNSGAPGVLPAGIQPSYWIVNGRVGVATIDDRYRVSIFANNLLNKEYFAFAASTGATGNTVTLANPRIVGVEAEVKF